MKHVIGLLADMLARDIRTQHAIPPFRLYAYKSQRPREAPGPQHILVR